jgi:transposase
MACSSGVNTRRFVSGFAATKGAAFRLYRWVKDAGVKPLFSPRYLTEQQAQERLLMLVRREPRQFGHPQSRWSLHSILSSCDWLRLETRGGLSRLLKRLGIGFKRARSYIHSPDRDYESKVSYLTLCRMRAWYEPQRYVLLYLDEFTYWRQPTLDRAYEQAGQQQALAYRSVRRDSEFRGIGALNAITGQVTYRQYAKINLRRLSEFYAHIRSDYPDAETIYVVQDNWPVHVHPDVLARLEPQHSPFWPTVPPNWPQQAHHTALQDTLPIQLVFLPTYASWLNPIEKLWRWLRQDVLHLHRLSQEWQALKQAVLDFIAQFALGSIDLLRYVGLLYD